VRESFVNHEDDVSAERLAQIVQRAREDAQWVLKKARGAPGSVPQRVPLCACLGAGRPLTAASLTWHVRPQYGSAGDPAA
jgi:hypothetical protein